MNDLVENLFFYPDSKDYGCYPKAKGVSFQDINFRSFDGTKLHGWFVRCNQDIPEGTLVHFHGNAANITNHWSFVAWATAQNLDVVIFDYRGYGQSEGQPSFQGMIEDCRSLFMLIDKADFIRLHHFIILGQSLGGFLSLAALCQEDLLNIYGFIADSTFFSIKSIIKSKISFLGDFLSESIANNLSDKQINIKDKLPQLIFPKLVIHSKRDPVVNYKLGKELYNQFSSPKEIILTNSSQHLSFFLDRPSQHWSKVMTFIKDSLRNYASS